MTLTDDQQIAYDAIMSFVGDKKRKLLTLGGFAGTGKTTLIGEVSKQLKKDKVRIAFCAFSGKASTVLRSKLKGLMDHDDYCGTIHSLIYTLVGKDKETRELYFDVGVESLDFDLIVIDEASMLNKTVFQDLADFGIPILAVGDHGQLPPVGGNFNLMENPDIKLEKIMRQAEGNPIIKLSMVAREEGKLRFEQGPHIKKVDKLYHLIESGELDYNNSIVLCAKNKTRVVTNNLVRKKLGITTGCPEVGEPLICLLNNRNQRIYNGNIGRLKEIQYYGSVYSVEINMGDFLFCGDIMPDQFGQQYLLERQQDMDMFDWAYCITVHKSQGSEWDNVCLIAERMGRQTDDEWRRWLYTGVTRAREKLFIIERKSIAQPRWI